MGARRWTVALDGYLIPIGGGREREVYDDGEQVVLAADHDRIVAEAEARGRAKGLEDAERAVRGLHIAVWSTIETGPEHACEDRSECDALERAERAIAALRKPEVEG